MHQSGMRIVAVVVVAAKTVLARKGTRGRSVEVNMLMMMWWCRWCCGHEGSMGGSLAFW